MSLPEIMQTSMEPLPEIVAHVVRTVHPTKIILFASAVRDGVNSSHDLDFLVVMPNGTDRLVTLKELRRKRTHFGVPLDFVVATEHDPAAYADSPWLVYAHALREGNVLHAA